MAKPLIAQGAEEFDPIGSDYTWARLQNGETEIYVLKTQYRNQYIAYVAICDHKGDSTAIFSWDHQVMLVSGTGQDVIMQAIDRWEADE